MSRSKKSLEYLETLIESLNEKSDSISKLKEAIYELKTHTTNIEKIENDIEIIKEEVIAPIKDELEGSKKAGKFSILGFWVGGLSIIISIISNINPIDNMKRILKDSSLTVYEESLKELQEISTYALAKVKDPAIYHEVLDFKKSWRLNRSENDDYFAIPYTCNDPSIKDILALKAAIDGHRSRFRYLVLADMDLGKDKIFKIFVSIFSQPIFTHGEYEEMDVDEIVSTFLDYHSKVTGTKNWRIRFDELLLQNRSEQLDLSDENIFHKAGFPENENVCFRAKMLSLSLNNWLYSFWLRRYQEENMEITFRLLKWLDKFGFSQTLELSSSGNQYKPAWSPPTK